MCVRERAGSALGKRGCPVHRAFIWYEALRF